MAKSEADKLVKKRLALVDRTALVLGVSKEMAIELLSIGRQQSVRVNPLKAGNDTLDTMKKLGWVGDRFEWCKDGYSVEAGLDEIKRSELANSGEIYIQNAASWLPVLALDPQANETILDVCAAPGGKTSHIAAITDNAAFITANDNSRPRLGKLRSNLERLGVEDVEFSLFDATQIAKKLEGQQFDKILLDAPCSGEGMMTYVSDKDFATWSVAHIKRLQQLQKRILAQSWQLLKPGGTLVYSTCTMAPEENEAVIDYLLRKNDDVNVIKLDVNLDNAAKPVMEWNGKSYRPGISKVLRLYPSQQIEAFFVAKLVKTTVL